MSDVKRSLLDMSPGGKTDDADDEPDDHIESNETFAEFCTSEFRIVFCNSICWLNFKITLQLL